MSFETLISEIDAEIARLQQAKQLLSGTSAPKKGPGRPRLTTTAAPAKHKRRVLSAAARARIAAAQKARWAKVKKAKTAASK